MARCVRPPGHICCGTAIDKCRCCCRAGEKSGSASKDRSAAADPSDSRRSLSFLRHRLRVPEAGTITTSSSSGDSDSGNEAAAADEADLEAGTGNGRSGGRTGVHKHGSRGGSDSSASSASEDYLRHRLRPQATQQQQRQQWQQQLELTGHPSRSGSPAGLSNGHGTPVADAAANGNISGSLQCSTPGAPDADGVSSLGGDFPTATTAGGTPQSSGRQLPISVGRASLEGMALRYVNAAPHIHFHMLIEVHVLAHVQ